MVYCLWYGEKAIIWMKSSNHLFEMIPIVIILPLQHKHICELAQTHTHAPWYVESNCKRVHAIVEILWSRSSRLRRQVKVQREIGKIRLQRISNMIQLQEASTQRRRDLSRARAAITRGSVNPSPTDIAHPDLLYDPAPQRARLSSSLVIPKIGRARLSN